MLTKEMMNALVNFLVSKQQTILEVLKVIQRNEASDAKLRLVQHGSSRLSKVVDGMLSCWRVVTEVLELPQCRVLSSLELLTG